MLETPQRLKDINAPSSKKRSSNSTPANLNKNYALKEQLVREMLALNKQREELEVGANRVDFSMLQTYKEMIHSRQQLLNQIDTGL